MSLLRPVVGVAVLCVLGLPGWALAASPPGSTADTQHGSDQTTTAHAQPVYVDGFGQAVSVGTLGHYSGGTLVQNNQTITGTVTGDSASQVTTGNNSISGDSFAGASGLPSVIQNTGNNVLIQNGVIVNVQMKP
jgi:hypothetical protein